MRIARDVILGLVLKHKEAFNALLDHVSMNGGSAQIPQALYLYQYNRLIVPSGDTLAIKALTLESLHDNGIVVHLDRYASTITLQAFIIDMLRFIDTSRIRELSHADFENMRLQFQQLCEKFETELIIIPGQIDYEEATIVLFDLIDTTLSKVQQNVEGLTANIDGLGRRYDKLDAQGHSSLDSKQLLEDAAQLYDRFIKPCHEFLSPSLGMKEGRKTFTASMERLISIHDQRGSSEVGMRIKYKMTAIRSYYKNIAALDVRVQRYTTTLAAERSRYKAIEIAYNQLLSAVAELRHGKQRNTKLSADAPVFRQLTSFKGLKGHHLKRISRLNWYNVPHRVRLDEWIGSLDTAPLTESTLELRPLSSAIDVVKQRRERVLILCLNKSWPDSLDDVVCELHRWLSSELEDYSLVDTLVAYQSCMALPLLKQRLHYTRERRQVTDQQYYFEYINTRLMPTSATADSTTIREREHA